MSNAPTVETFLRDVADHEMIVLQDNGVHRHILFKNPETSVEHFSILTFPGFLCYSGDMGTFVFHRTHDMFEFFRADAYRERRGGGLCVNLSYWAEKVEAIDRHGSIKEFDADKFRARIWERFVDWARDHRDETGKEERRELWEAICSEVLDIDDSDNGMRRQAAAYDFGLQVNQAVYFRFQDFYEVSVERYSYRFVWCCYALAWAIKKYDAAKVVAVEGEVKS